MREGAAAGAQESRGARSWTRFSVAALVVAAGLWFFVWVPLAIALTEMGECQYQSVRCNAAGEALATDAGFLLGSLIPLALGVAIALAVRPPSARRIRVTTASLIVLTAALWAVALASTAVAVLDTPGAGVLGYGMLAWTPAYVLTPFALVALVRAGVRRAYARRRARSSATQAAPRRPSQSGVSST